jgi:hypothetical protein
MRKTEANMNLLLFLQSDEEFTFGKQKPGSNSCPFKSLTANRTAWRMSPT